MTIDRFVIDSPFGVFGKLRHSSGFDCWTVEQPWRNNAPWISCVPAGTYELIGRKYNRGGYLTVELANVPNRTACLIHVGNTMLAVRGCVAVGNSLGWLRGMWGVANSSQTFAELEDAMGGFVAGQTYGTLTIRWLKGEAT